ncbi:MAG TPA: hypothetical protein VIB62_07645 [Actinomycetota bacterium]|jgi:hypothetical protein
MPRVPPDHDEPLERHREALERLHAAVVESSGVLPPDERAAAATRAGVPERFSSYVGAIHDHASRITDATVAELQAGGASDDEVFEITVAAAYGAARRRLDAALGAVRAATEER